MNHYIPNFSTKKFKMSLGFLFKTLFLIFFTVKNSFSFEVNEVAKGLFVHFGQQEDSNSKNNGDIANIGFIVGSQSIAVIDTGGTPEIGMKLLKKIKETSRLFRWFNCLAYSTLSALIARIVIFPSGSLSEIDYLIRFIVIILSIVVFYLTKKNLVYPTLFSAIILSILSSYV